MTTYLCRLNLSTVLDKLAGELGVGTEMLGTAGSLYFAACAVGGLINGYLGDRVNPHRFLMLALAMTGGVNLALSVCPSLPLLLALWAVNGFSQSMFWGTLLRLLSGYTPVGERKLVSTVMSTCSVAGYLLSWVVLGTLFQRRTSRPYFLVPSVIALALIPVWCITSKRIPAASPVEKRPPAPPLRQLIHEIFRDRLFFICFLCLLIGAIQEGAVFWLPGIAENILNLGGNSILLLTLVPFAKLAGIFLARGLLSAFGDRIRRCMSVLLAASGALSLILLFAGGHTSFFTVLLIAVLIMVINGCNWYTISYLPLFFTGRSIVATLACLFDFSTYLGASFTSGLLGFLLEQYGWMSLPTLWLGLSSLGLGLVLTGVGTTLVRITE